ncbi:Aspartic peptidase, active site [Sesbania bispinosa]|nr:Aspartic peptidase, active site [Sesbania bispinosa]
METRLQARIEANESRLVNLENQIQNPVQSLTSMQESLTEKHEQQEFRNLIVKFMREQVKQPSDEDDGAETENSHGSRTEFESDTHLVAKRVQLPPFEGGDLRGWISRAETYFRIHQTKPDMRISMAQVCMEGQVVHWFNILLEINPDISWDQVHNPETRLQTMKLARNVEIALKKLSGGVGRSTIPFKGPHLVGQMKQVNTWPKRHGANADYEANHDKNYGGVFGNLKSGTANFKLGTLNLTTIEWEERRHEMVNETGEVVVAEVEEESEMEEGECSVLDCKKMWDGYNITKDKSRPLKTLKLEGSVNGIPILILVDSGATHNFISPKVVKALGISVEKADKGLAI